MLHNVLIFTGLPGWAKLLGKFCHPRKTIYMTTTIDTEEHPGCV